MRSIKPLPRSGGETLREGLYRTLLTAIVEGRLEPGARLPSARELAHDWQVSRNTVDDAIGALQAEGLVERRVGVGTHVSVLAGDRQPPRQREPRRPSPFGREALAQLSRWGRNVVATHDARASPRPLAFMAALPDVDRFPHELWRRLAARRLRHDARALARYLPPLGWPPLQQAIARHLAIARGLVCDPAQVLVLNSSMQAADLIARVLLGRGDRAWIEDPSFPNLRGALAMSGARLVPVPVDEHGLDVAAGRALADDAALAYVTPACHYPLGVALSMDRRRALLDWAAAANAWIVEDDYHGETAYDGRASAPLASLDRSGRVLFVGSFSHTVFPSLRLAFVVLPAALVDVFAAVRAQLDDHTHGLGQAMLADFIEGGYYAAHLRRMRDVYRDRRDAIVAASRLLPAGFALGPARAGFSVTLLATRQRSDVALAAQVARQGVRTLPLSRYAIGRARIQGLLLGYAALDERTIVQAMRRLRSALSPGR